MVDSKELEFNAGDRTFTSKREQATRSRRSLYRGSILLEDVTSCSTAVANVLSQQIIDEMNLIVPNVLIRFERLNVSAVDGFYGKETKMAVKQFQKRTGLMVDGVFGSATHRKLFRRFS